MLRRTFRNVAVIAGLIERNHPGAREDPPAGDGEQRPDLRRAAPPPARPHPAARHPRRRRRRPDRPRRGSPACWSGRRGGCVHMALSRVSPLAVPVLLEIGRESVRTRRRRGRAAGRSRGADRRGDRRGRAAADRAAAAEACRRRTGQRRSAACATAARRHDRRPDPSRRRAADARPGRRAVLAGAGLLAVSDLHLEKGSSARRRGKLLPPWDTRATLDRLACCCAATGRRRWSRWATASTMRTRPAGWQPPRQAVSRQ